MSLVPAARRPEGSYLPETDAAREFREQMVTPPQRRCSGHRCPVCRRPTPGGRNATRAACLVTRGPSGTPAPFSVAWPPSQLPRGSACHLRGRPSWEPPRHLPKYLDQTTKDTRLLREATGDQRPHTRDDCLGRRPQMNPYFRWGPKARRGPLALSGDLAHRDADSPEASAAPWRALLSGRETFSFHPREGSSWNLKCS